MRAVLLKEFGAAANYELHDIPVPEPKDNQILIKVGVAGIVFSDTQVRKGNYVSIATLPLVPGREVAGTVEKVGPEVRRIGVGMRVSAYLLAGGYAEYAIADEDSAIILPDRVTWEQAIVHHINLRIAYLFFFTFGKVQPGETILLHAAAGGVGTLLARIAKRRGSDNTVIALSSSDEKLAHCRAVGADYCINYHKSDYVEEVLSITGGKGVDVSMNSVGGKTLETDYLVIRPRGRWLINGYAGGKGLIDPYAFILKSLTLSIFSVYTVQNDEDYLLATQFLEEWLRSEKLEGCSKIFRLEDVVQAHEWIEGQHSIGKIGLIP
jgi:NADPH2:quinone reductase